MLKGPLSIFLFGRYGSFLVSCKAIIIYIVELHYSQSAMINLSSASNNSGVSEITLIVLIRSCDCTNVLLVKLLITLIENSEISLVLVTITEILVL